MKTFTTYITESTSNAPKSLEIKGAELQHIFDDFVQDPKIISKLKTAKLILNHNDYDIKVYDLGMFSFVAIYDTGEIEEYKKFAGTLNVSYYTLGDMIDSLKSNDDRRRWE